MTASATPALPKGPNMLDKPLSPRRATIFLAALLALLLAVAGASVYTLTAVWADRPSHAKIGEVGGVTLYRTGIPTSDGLVAECVVTDRGGIWCRQPVQDSR